MKVHRKPLEFEAMQWNASNVEKIIAWLNPHFVEFSPAPDRWELTWWYYDEKHSIEVRDGYWIVKENEIRAYGPETFKRLFTEGEAA